MKPRINDAQISKLAQDAGYEFEALKAVIMVESAGSGFSKDDVIIIQFEPHYFKHKLINNGVENQAKEWIAFNEAYAINKEDAMRATSWGMGQIMGFNCKLAGYPTAEAMKNDFNKGEYQQVRGMLRMINSQPQLDKALKTRNWKSFAYYYNGPAYARNKYDEKLEKAYNNLKHK